MWYAVTTGLTPHEALQQATAYFGRGGVGLHAIAQTMLDRHGAERSRRGRRRSHI